MRYLKQIASRKPQLPSKSIKPYLFIGLIIILPWILFWRWVFKGEVLFWGTTLFQFWPWHYLAKISALGGEWPLWNPLLGNGTPLLANLQTAFFYPLNLLYLLMSVEHSLTLSVILHLLLAGLFMTAYTRAIGLSSFAAGLSGLTYMFSGYLLGRTQFITMINAAAWFPLLLLLAERVATRRNALTPIGLGLVLAIQILAGHAQLWFYGLWLLSAYIIFRSWQESRRWQAVFQAIWRFGWSVGISFLLAAIQLLPTAELMLESPRSSGADRFFALSYSFWPWRFITLLAPNFFGHPANGNYWGYANYWEDHAYVGVLPLLLALIAIWHSKPWNRSYLADSPVYHRVVPFFFWLIPISLILALGWNTPIYLWVFQFVPGFKYFQAPARLLIWYTLAITVLAGIGAQIFTKPQNRQRLYQLLMVCAGITIAGLAGRIVLAGRSLTFLNATLTTGILLTASIIILLTHPGEKRIGRHTLIWQTAMFLFVSLDLLWFAYPLIPTLPAAIFRQPVASAVFLKNQPVETRYWVDNNFDHTVKFDTYFRFDAFGPMQMDYWQGFKETLTPNTSVYANLQSANNDDPLVVGRWQQLVNLIDKAAPEQQARLLSLMNVGYAINTPRQINGTAIYQNETMAIESVPDVLPHAYFVTHARRATTEAEVIAQLNSPHFDPRREVIIMDTNGVLMSGNIPAETSSFIPATVIHPRANQVSLEITAPAPGFVVLTDTFYPGWTATVDGEATPIWPANLAFRAVKVEAGRHEIIFTYHSRTFFAGLWISAAALVMVAAGAGYHILSQFGRRRADRLPEDRTNF